MTDGESAALLAASIGTLLRSDPDRWTAVWGVGFMRRRLHRWIDAAGEDCVHELHIWDPSLRATDMDDSGMIHDHPFDLRSVVLLGAVHDTEVVSLLPSDEEGDDGVYQVHEVDPPEPPEVSALGTVDGTTYTIEEEVDTRPRPRLNVRALPQRYRLATSEHTYAAGATYRYARRRFHRGEVSGLTVTFCTLRGALNGGGRLLARSGRIPVHVGDRWGAELFEPGHCRALISRAAASLLERSRL